MLYHVRVPVVDPGQGPPAPGFDCIALCGDPDVGEHHMLDPVSFYRVGISRNDGEWKTRLYCGDCGDFLTRISSQVILRQKRHPAIHGEPAKFRVRRKGWAYVVTENDTDRDFYSGAERVAVRICRELNETGRAELMHPSDFDQPAPGGTR